MTQHLAGFRQSLYFVEVRLLTGCLHWQLTDSCRPLAVLEQHLAVAGRLAALESPAQSFLDALLLSLSHRFD